MHVCRLFGDMCPSPDSAGQLSSGNARGLTCSQIMETGIYLVILFVKYVYTFIEKQSCAFIIYISCCIRLCLRRKAGCVACSLLLRIIVVYYIRNSPFLREYRTTGWLECYVNKSVIKTKNCVLLLVPLTATIWCP